jgi:hypothetical protein
MTLAKNRRGVSWKVAQKSAFSSYGLEAPSSPSPILSLVRKAVLIALAVVAGVVVLPVVATLVFFLVDSVHVIASERGECSESQIRVFGEFPQYGGKRLEPEYNSQGCFVAFTTEDPPEDVRSYYTRQLAARGWTLDQPPPPVPGQEPGALDAARGRNGYEVLTESTREGTSVVAYVIEREA